MHPRVKENPAPDYETLRHLYVVERKTVRQIAQELGFASKTSIQNFLREYDIEARDAHNGLVNRGIQEPTRDELIDLIHVQHLRYEDIADLYGVEKTTIGSWLKRHEIPRLTPRDSYYKGSPPILPTKEELESLYASGLSLTAIGIEYGVNEIVIRRLFREFGLQARPDGWDGGKRFECKDGHMVRSTYEMRADNWLFENGIMHLYEPPLPCDKHYHADFIANGWYIEIWGVTQNEQYTQRRKRKTQLYQDHSLPLIEIETYHFQSDRHSQWARILKKVFAAAPIPLFDLPDESRQ